MKNKKSLNLFNQNKSKLDKKQAASIKGGSGYLCGCGCYYADEGGSSRDDNGCANADGGLKSQPR